MAAAGAASSDGARPLAGVRVLAQAIVWAGPFGSMILADLGAEVIEVESIQHLNPTRTTLRHIPPSAVAGPRGALYANRDMSEGFWNRQAYFNFSKRGHKSITLNLRRERGRELFYELVRQSDVYIENNAADVVEQLGLDYPQLSAVNPRLIMVRFPGFGIRGPYRNFKGYGATMEAIVGHTMVRGYRDSDPSFTPAIYHGDPNAGAHVAFAVEAALYARERTGEGQLVELSQAEAVIHHTAYSLMDYSMNRRVQPHWGNRHPSMAPYGIFPCREDEGVEHELRPWVAIAVPSDKAFAALCRAIGAAELADDPRYADVVSRYRRQDELEPRISDWTASRTRGEVVTRLRAAGVPAAAVVRQSELSADPHLDARGYWEEIAHPEAGTHRLPGPMAHFERTPLSPVAGPAPTLGQHNHEILVGLLGLSEDEYQRLEQDELIGTAYLEGASAD